MRENKRIDLLCEQLNKTWKTMYCSDMRFGQFISNFMGWIMSEKKCSDIWFPEDEKWIEWLKEYADLYNKGE